MDKKAAMQRIIELTYSEDWHGDKLLVTGTAEQLASLTGLHEKIVRKRARCGYTDVKKRTFRYVEESS